MTQSTKTLYAGNQARSPESLNRADARQFSEPACELQSAETLDPSPGSAKDIRPPTGLLLERPMEWIAECCPFNERHQRRNKPHKHSSGESGSVDCLH